MAKILIIGNPFDKHICRFIKNLNCKENNLFIDIFDITTITNTNYSKEVNEFRNVFVIKKHFNKVLYTIKGINYFVKLFDLYKSFFPIRLKRYDLINIQYFTRHSFFLCFLYKRICKKIMITPWGSDVYQINFLDRQLAKWTYKQADFVALPKVRFGEDVKAIYKIPKNKIIELSFGSDILDILIKNPNLTRDLAKEKLLGSKDFFTVVIGYNGAKGQNHLEIIFALNEVKSILPANTILLFPMTYSKDDHYISLIRDKLQILGIKYIIYDSYLSAEKMLYLRKLADIFIHMQNTDAYSTSLQEYLFAGAAVINAAWLRYSELEINGVPYYLVKSTKELAKTLKYVLLNKKTGDISNILKEVISKNAWSNLIVEWQKFYKSFDQK